ncbi:hypothetical protein DEO72_LG10g2374 [Vigna unguiculata]|uniref:Uncharacterized protein n=1 Tax=Vigna unguiculata TaxID=3917 RepID=A0A4D6NE42_VIGUN|nr:hypothetical protein DEO72_LG10g2374 [Vigna unguiculata]
MSPRRPSGSDKGKKKTKPRRQPPGYIIRVLGQIPQSAPIQAPLLAGVPTPHPAGEEFSTRLSQVRSEQGSYADVSEHNDDADKEDVIRT